MSRDATDPLPIWFFVGLILLAYGLIVAASGLLMDVPPTVHRVTSSPPGILWGALMTVVGAVFLAVGLRKRGEAR